MSRTMIDRKLHGIEAVPDHAMGWHWIAKTSEGMVAVFVDATHVTWVSMSSKDAETLGLTDIAPMPLTSRP